MLMTWAEAHRLGMVAATHAHDRLGVDLTRRIDVFSAIERSGVVLAFEPLREASGAYVAEPGAQPGIVVNSQHLMARQRYTAAHELGHHALGHGSSVDPEVEPLERWGTAREVPQHEKEAEAFAAWFLMPRVLVRGLLQQMRIDRPASPDQVYALSLRLGTSYEATARHLPNLKLATRAVVARWLNVQPREIKLSLSPSAQENFNLRSDVWTLSEADNTGIVTVRPGDRLILALPEVPSSGHRWEVRFAPDWMEVVAHAMQSLSEAIGDGEQDAVGVAGTHEFVVDVSSDAPDGTDELRLAEAQPWDPDVTTKEFTVTVVVERPRRGIREELLAVTAA